MKRGIRLLGLTSPRPITDHGFSGPDHGPQGLARDEPQGRVTNESPDPRFGWTRTRSRVGREPQPARHRSHLRTG